MEWLKDWLSDLHPMTKRGIVFTLAAVLVFTIGLGCGSVTNVNANVDGDLPAGNNAVVAPTTTQATAPTTTAQTTASQVQDSTTDSKPETPKDDKADAPVASNGAPETKEEIVAYFNTAADKVKTDASKVTRNYEDLRHDEEHLVLPSALESIGSGLISTFLKKNDTPVEWTGGDIANKYPVAGQSWASKATAADVSEAKCTDDGTYYNIELKFNESVDPAEGTGVASTFNVIKADDVYEAASVVKSFSGKYYDCTVKAKIDKATGHIVWANYTTPIVLSVTASVLVTLDAQVGMTFEYDYTIDY